jgi:integrase
VTLYKTRPSAGKRWTDSGDVHDDWGLKHRADEDTRTVPIPPELVALIRWHLDRFGTDKDGYLFRSDKGNPISASSYWRVWQEARELALLPHQVDSPLPARPYDQRHAGISLMLNAGVPASETADRAGNSVEVLLKVYAKCIDGDKAIMNARIELALAA